ncbi:DUF3299 domain-containing protein [Nitrosospira sp. Nsp13]|uniref:DUF3299 domain-containing protein n=1 Tax=Nitrosospira sp. Nsp13 TaxID=1855332 RepID=UPI00088F2333|nr:DUF3299 domain-containing protein [Nitrosospira sp. Nsp13]SCX80100.1 hypothetical protein SAMN05216308_101310 [Nitrosospira sp. Nsp13]
MTASLYVIPLRFRILFLIALLIFTAQTAISADKDYKVGDRLSVPAPGAAKNKPAPSGTASAGYKEKTWDDLMPKNWDPMAPLKGLKLDNLKDGDPRAIEALEKIRAAWNNAPIEPALDGERIRIPGFVIPLERAGNKVSEFLLVPYFGACIHTPPPPSNQIIHVRTSKPLSNMRTMDTMWVSGVLHAGSIDTEMGQAGYQLKAEWVTPYP